MKSESKVNEQLLNFYKEAYSFEAERQERLTNRTALLLGILAILSGLVTFYLDNFKLEEISASSSFFLICLIFLAITIGHSIITIYRFLVGYEYGYISNTESIGEYFDNLKDYNEGAVADKKIDLNIELISLLEEQYRKAAGHNRQVNNARSGDYIRALRLIIWAVALTLLCAIPFFLDRVVN